MVSAHKLAQKTGHLPLLKLIERVPLINGLTAALWGLSIKEGSHNGAFCDTGARTSKLLPDLMLCSFFATRGPFESVAGLSPAGATHGADTSSTPRSSIIADGFCVPLRRKRLRLGEPTTGDEELLDRERNEETSPRGLGCFTSIGNM